MQTTRFKLDRSYKWEKRVGCCVPSKDSLTIIKCEKCGSRNVFHNYHLDNTYCYDCSAKGSAIVYREWIDSEGVTQRRPYKPYEMKSRKPLLVLKKG